MLCALTLVDDHRGAYVVASAFIGLATFIGIGLHRRVPRLGKASVVILVVSAPIAGSVLGVVLSGLGVTGVGWLLGLVSGLAASALLCAPSFASQRSGLLLVPVAAVVAVTALFSAFTFYARPVPNTLGNDTAWLKLPPGRRVSPVAFIVAYEFHGCSNPVTVRFSYPRGQLGSAQAVLTQGIFALPSDRGYRLTPANDPRFGGGSDALTNTSEQLHPRGFIGSCYLALSAFLGPWSGVRERHGSFTLVHAARLTEAVNFVVLNGGSLSVLSGHPPTQAGDPSTWVCRASAEKQSPASDCSAIVMLTDSWYQAWQNLMLLFIGALFAAVVALVGRAIAGFGWFTVEPARKSSERPRHDRWRSLIKRLTNR